MFENLKAEMARFNKTNQDVGDILGISANSVSFKLNGKTPFTLHEIWKLLLRRLKFQQDLRCFK